MVLTKSGSWVKSRFGSEALERSDWNTFLALAPTYPKSGQTLPEDSRTEAVCKCCHWLAAKLAMEQALTQADDEWLFPQYIKAGHCYATHASNAVNKWFKKDFDGKIAHSLRHTFRDRLRAVECPIDMIDQIGGWRSLSSVGSKYGEGYSHQLTFEKMMAVKI